MSSQKSIPFLGIKAIWSKKSAENGMYSCEEIFVSPDKTLTLRTGNEKKAITAVVRVPEDFLSKKMLEYTISYITKEGEELIPDRMLIGNFWFPLEKDLQSILELSSDESLALELTTEQDDPSKKSSFLIEQNRF